MIHIAVYLCKFQHGDADAKIKLLIDQGIDINQGCKQGDTPVMLLIRKRSYQSESIEILQALIDNGANVNYVNGNGQTAMSCLKPNMKGFSKFVAVLLQADFSNFT